MDCGIFKVCMIHIFQKTVSSIFARNVVLCMQHISGTEQIFKYLFVVLYLHCNGQFERIFSELSELFSFDVKLKVPFVNSVYLTMQQVSQQP